MAKLSSYFLFIFLGMVQFSQFAVARPRWPADVKYTGDVNSVDLLKLYEKSPYKIGEALPEEVKQPKSSVHCPKPEFEPGNSGWEPLEWVANYAMNCFVFDPKVPFGVISFGIWKQNGTNPNSITYEFKENITRKDIKEWNEKFANHWIVPVHAWDTLNFGIAAINKNVYARVTFSRKTKDGVALKSATLYDCNFKTNPATLEPDSHGEICTYVRGEKEGQAKHLIYQPPPPPPKHTTADIEAALSPSALIKLIKIKVGETLPEDKRSADTLPEYCPEGWKPGRNDFYDRFNPKPVLDFGMFGCNSGDDKNILLGMDYSADRATAKITTVSFLVQEKRIKASSLKEMDKLLGNAALANSTTGEHKKFMNGPGYFYYNKLEPNLIFSYSVEGSGKRFILDSIRVEDCNAAKPAHLNYSLCEKWKLIKK